MKIYNYYKSTFSSVEIQKFLEKLNKIQFKELSLVEYNLDYLEKMKPNFFYYLQMFDFTISHLLNGEKPNQRWIVDFGGGHGILSLYLKSKGFNVIYCDYNPTSVETAKKLSQSVGYDIDFFVQGSAKELADIIQTNQLDVQFVISTDTIEHVSDLDEMMHELRRINKQLKIVFTTASNPKNHYKVRRLRKVMQNDENQNILPLRRAYIAENFSDLDDTLVDQLAVNSRGLKYDQLDEFVHYFLKHQRMQKVDVDKFNCCEPVFGTWTERVLPLSDYNKLGDKNQFDLVISNMFYAVNDKSGIKKIIARFMNYFVLHLPQIGRFFSPSILLEYRSK